VREGVDGEVSMTIRERRNMKGEDDRRQVEMD
jgi:hypothetical protein